MWLFLQLKSLGKRYCKGAQIIELKYDNSFFFLKFSALNIIKKKIMQKVFFFCLQKLLV